MTLTTILIVEPDKRITAMLQEQLVKEELTVMTAASGREGLFLFKKHSIQLVVAEAHIGEEADFAFIQAVKAISDVPILVLSSLSHDAHRIHGFEIGVADYVVKPFSPREVVLRIQRLLTYFYQPSPFKKVGDVYVFSFLSLDLNNRQVSIDQKKVNLTPREFQLLRYFVEHADQVISRQELLQGVWGYAFLGEERTVDVHIRKLRHKLNEYSSVAAVAIQTEWKRGYRFNSEPRVEP
ncbi:response regulator transcription factor [Vagococcus sp. BWB3-3]|uniref:Response regulator transcription factor n=1 Tax=Vagococcus allomyrinae TaxID=2794353 RepID=A0A940STT0_9ENTE|nr:response regulator transcription factor [Vagococcus allomyrinae]MBP1040620.1 response regulator transcription factor [Vagococcus allomyrinae]